MSFEVSLVKRLEVALVRACGRGLASWWDRVGEVGGAEYTGAPRSLSCPPWKVLRIVEPRVRRHRSEEDDEAAPAPEMLSVDGDAAGMRWPRELRSKDRKGQKIFVQQVRKWKCDFDQDFCCLNSSSGGEDLKWNVALHLRIETNDDDLTKWRVKVCDVRCKYNAAAAARRSA